MAKIHSVSINNFRGIKEFKQSFYEKPFICIIGRGDSGKSTILEAISSALSSSWNITFYDSDFYNCDTSLPIVIEATLYNLPDYFLNEKYGLFLRGINPEGDIFDDFEIDEGIPAITIRLEVKDDLEPKWYIINSRPHQEPIVISAAARARFNAFLISDFTDRHFSWSKGNPLYSILQKEGPPENEGKNIVINAFRKAKGDIDTAKFDELSGPIEKVIKKASELGVDIRKANTTIDFKDISIKDNRVCLHDEIKIPFRLKGKGIKRLISIAIQLTLVDNGGIILIDEIEQGLEPDRVQHLVNQLKKHSAGQIFITTHSSNVAVELDATDFMIMKTKANDLIQVDLSLQGAIRKNPEALFARKLIICEGATEVGICRAINDHRISIGRPNAAYNGIRVVDGTGSGFIEYCKGFHSIGFKLIAFCDNDESAINSKKNQLTLLGIDIAESEISNSIESQVFKDLPWNGIKELITYQIEKSSLQSVKDSIESRISASLQIDWIEIESSALRIALGTIANNSEWFKRTDHGEYLGSVICKYIGEMNPCRLKNQFEKIIEWMDDV